MTPRIKALNEENSEAIMPLIKLEFTKNPFETAKLDQDDNVIIVLKDAKDKAENLLRIAERYVHKGVMPRGRRLVDSKTEQAVEVALIFRLLSNVVEALRLWEERHYKQCLDNSEIREKLEKVYYIDKQGGYLTRMFLPQLELIALREGPIIRPGFVAESESWLNNIYNIALKHHDDPDTYTKEFGDLTFIQDDFGVQVVLVAVSARIREFGLELHKRRILMALANPAIDFIYIIGMGEVNCFHSVRLFGETYLDSRVTNIWATFYKTRSRGNDFSPMTLIRYSKGSLPNTETKKQQFNSFQKIVRKELKKERVTPDRLMDWIVKEGELYVGAKYVLSRNDAAEISKTMNNNDMTMDVLPYLFENNELTLRYEELLDEYDVQTVSIRDKILFRIHALLGKENNDIIPYLEPKIFMKKK